MKKLLLLLIPVAVFVVPPVFSEELPIALFELHGVIKDWKTNNGVADAKVLVFIDDISTMNDGSRDRQKDFPDLPATSGDGTFTASAWSPFTPMGSAPRTIEIVVLANGYRTERFKLLASQVEFEKDNTVIKLPELKVATYQELNAP
jgi:hypothetical protein